MIDHRFVYRPHVAEAVERRTVSRDVARLIEAKVAEEVELGLLRAAFG